MDEDKLDNHLPKKYGPNMDDVPFGEPSTEYRPVSIGQGLLDLANWFDVYDDRNGYRGDRSVQRDLRTWAKRTMDMKA